MSRRTAASAPIGTARPAPGATYTTNLGIQEIFLRRQGAGTKFTNEGHEREMTFYLLLTLSVRAADEHAGRVAW
jgi:hypothetical protein